MGEKPKGPSGVLFPAVLTVVALWAMAIVVLVGFVFFAFFAPHRGREPRDTRPFQKTTATFVVAVDYETPPVHQRQSVLRLDPRDQDALGLDHWLIDSTRSRGLRIPTSHILRSRDEVHQYCLTAEAEFHDYGTGAQQVIPPGTCLRSDEPLSILIPD